MTERSTNAKLRMANKLADEQKLLAGSMIKIHKFLSQTNPDQPASVLRECSKRKINYKKMYAVIEAQQNLDKRARRTKTSASSYD